MSCAPGRAFFDAGVGIDEQVGVGRRRFGEPGEVRSGRITVRCPTGDEGVGATLNDALADLERNASGCGHCLAVVVEAVHLG